MQKLKYDDWIKRITIIVDNQEKVNNWIIDFFKKNSIAYEKKHMKAGDYGFTLDGKPQAIIIERKNSLTELSGNLSTKDKKERFYREFDNVKSCEKYLLIENDSIDNLLSGTYGSEYNSNSYIANLLLLQSRKDLRIYFVNKYNMGLLITKIFYYYYYRKEAKNE